MRAFIIRPFGVKEGIDFERVDKDLIQAALNGLEKHGISIQGATTGEISRQGNIREDMFRLIVVADLVIADVSIHNANAFYELGIRHALRPRHTFLLRSKTEHAYPFDLQTDRYFLYDAANPAGSVDGLVRALRSTLSAVERDSPVFALLPQLAPHGRGQLVKVPDDFREDVERARRDAHPGDLRLYAQEVTSFDWDQEGLQLIGEAQFKLRAFAGARETFESLRSAVPEDVQANLRLGTIYQRLAQNEPVERREALRVQSEQAIDRVIRQKKAPVGNLVEAYSLQASNEKSRWMEDISGAAPEALAARALGSVYLENMLTLYLKAANLNLNAHYPAINALALLKIQLELAARAPQAWQARFDDDAKAAAALKAREALASRLVSSLCLALELDEVMGRREGDPDPWAASSRADFMLLTSSNRAERIEGEYRRALAGADRFTLEAARRNLAIYKDLGLFEPGLSAALRVVDGAIAGAEKARPAPARIVLFTGHMVDVASRPKDKMRFPPTPEAEAKARAMIEETLRAEVAGREAETLGIAGGACGADILFHEICGQLGVRTELYLALPEDKFQVTSVQRGGPKWVERYRSLLKRLSPPRMLQQGEALPRWLADKPDYNLWERNNLWMMFNAIATGSRDLSLVAFYNPQREPDGPGGTRHLVDEASKWAFKYVHIDAGELLQDR